MVSLTIVRKKRRIMARDDAVGESKASKMKEAGNKQIPGEYF